MKKFWVILFGVIGVGLFGLIGFGSGEANATSSSIMLSIDNSSIGVDVVPQGASGTFVKSSASNISVVTNNATGYTLSIKANNSTDLVNTNDNTKVIPTISNAVSESDFMSDSNYANMWGYLPSKINSTDNTDFLPSPSTTGDVIDATTTANADANSYTMVLGTKIASDTEPGVYNNTFTLMAIANAIPYSITYNANGGSDTVTNMPANINSTTYAETVTLDSTEPERDGYSFEGWCTIQVADGFGCTGTTYQPSDEWVIDRISTVNSLSLYSMWTEELIMQEMSSSQCPTTPINVVDSRDGQIYKVAKLADGRCWLLDNLRLDIVAKKNSIDSSNTNATDTQLNYLKNGGGVTSDQYPSTGVAYWTTGGDLLYSEPTIATSGDCNVYAVRDGHCANYPESGKWTADSLPPDQNGEHAYYGAGSGKIGVYYNYCAASAGTYCWGRNLGPGSDPKPSSLYDIDGDICPKGWRMPTGSSSGEYQALFTTYSSIETATDSSSFQYNLSTPLSGQLGPSGGTASIQGEYGYFWSSTRYGITNMYYLYVGPSVVRPSSYYYSDSFYSVRCVLDV